MSIGVLALALLMVTMPGKCKIEEKGFHPFANLTYTSSDPETGTEFANVTAQYEISPKTTTGYYDATVFEYPNHAPAGKKPAKIKSELETAIWPVKHAAEMVGDLILGGLMMVHEREDSVTCGPIMPQGGIQALETMLYTLDVINKMELLPNITVGAHILDDCDKDTYGLEMAVDFIKVTGRAAPDGENPSDENLRQVKAKGHDEGSNKEEKRIREHENSGEF